MLILQNISYLHSHKEQLFHQVHLSLERHEKIALVGNNGSGKSTLLRIIAGSLQPAGGSVQLHGTVYTVPQVYGQYDELTVAEALQVAPRYQALQAILSGHVTEANLATLGDDWNLEERCHEAFSRWNIGEAGLSQKMKELSGGQKTKVFLAGIAIHQPDLVLLDEPGNHLDREGRQLLYSFIRETHHSLLIVSHDPRLLNLLPVICELGKDGIRRYGGNYDFYAEQKAAEREALHDDIRNKEKELRKAKESAREISERQQKLDARGKKKQEKAGLPKILMNTFRNNAENSTARMKDVQAGKTGALLKELQELRSVLPAADQMKFGLKDSALHKGKLLFAARDLNYSYGGRRLWQEGLDIKIESGGRIALKGANGSGKTTLVKIIMGELEPGEGMVHRTATHAIYIDQDYSLIGMQGTVYERIRQFSSETLEEHQLKTKLHHFLFTKEDWDKPCSGLSGGERMRLLLCCLSSSLQVPDLLVLDEPTNNLNLQNVAILTAAINAYEGTLIVISHDDHFLSAIATERSVVLSR